MRTFRVLLPLAFLVLAMLVGPRSVRAQCSYGFPPAEPPLPEVSNIDPPLDVNNSAAVSALEGDIANRLNDSSSLGTPLEIQMGGPERMQSFQSLSGGEQLAAQGKSPVSAFESAAAGFRRVLARNPDDRGARRGLIRAMSGICGYESMQRGTAQEESCILKAKLEALEGLKRAPDDPGLLHLYGNLESSLATRAGASAEERAKSSAAAEASYRKAAAGGYIFSQYSLGLLYLSLGNYRKAQAELRRFQSAFPDAPPGLEQSLKDLDKAIAAEPGGKLDAAFESLLLAGNYDAAAKQFTEGLADLHKALGVPAGQELNSAPAHDRFRHASAHYDLAAVLARAGKIDAAFQNLEQALQLGWAKGASANDRRGKGQLRNVLESDPDLKALRDKDQARWDQKIVPLLGK